MTTDARAATRMPATVLTAAVLIGFFGAVGGLGAVAFGALRFNDGGWRSILVGAGVLLGAAAWDYGLVNRYRAAQIAAGVVGLCGMLAAVTALTQGNLLNVAWSAVAVVAGGVAVLPVSARSWFDESETTFSRRAAGVAAVATIGVVGAATYVFMTGTLQWTDPAGAKSCAMLSDALDNGSLNDKLSGEIGDIGKDSTTPAIRATVHLNPKLGPELDAVAFLDDLHAACVASGVDMPAYPA